MEPFHLCATVNRGSQITDLYQGLIVIDGQLLRAHHKAFEATSGSEEVGWGGLVGEWVAGWEIKGLRARVMPQLSSH